MPSLFKLITHVTVYYAVTLSFIALLIYPRLTKIFKVFALYLIVSGCIDFISISFKTNNLVFFHLFSILETGILGMFFAYLFKILTPSLSIKPLLYISIGIIVANSIFLQPLDRVNTYGITYVGLLMIGFSIKSFIHFLEVDNTPSLKLLQHIVTGIFVYHMSIIFVSLLGNTLLFDLFINDNLQKTIWLVRAIIILMVKIWFTYILYRHLTIDKKVSA